MSSTRSGRLSDGIHPINEFYQRQGQSTVQSRPSRPKSLPNPNIEWSLHPQSNANGYESTWIDNSFQIQRSRHNEYYHRRNSDRVINEEHNYMVKNSIRNTRSKTIASFPIVSTNVTTGTVNNDELAKTHERSNGDAEDSVSTDQPYVSSTSESGKDVGARTAFYNQSSNAGSRLARKRKHQQTLSPDITQLTKKDARQSTSRSRTEVKECIENEEVDAVDPLSEAETEVEEIISEEPSLPVQSTSTVTRRRSFAVCQRSSLAEDFDTERKVPPQINNDDRKYQEFNVPGMFGWLEKQLLKTSPKSNVIKRFADILKREEVFIALRYQLTTIRNNPYLMRKNSLDELFFLLSKTLCAITEGEMNAILSEYQGILGVLTGPRLGR
ncbi:unnamed protein product [Orchesella dallaii]|uniref:Uncharacterized protein n=1 Tax=Orchesella dallaii TaxID=48710 RepID=A0ABP1QLI8_9HEXA